MTTSPSNRVSLEQYNMRRAMPLEDKIRYSKRRIEDWVRFHGVKGVYVSFSGGKDSTVLLHMVRSMYPDVLAVFIDTGLEYPEIKEHVARTDNVVVLSPTAGFKRVVTEYGYPIISKEVAEVIEQARRCIESGGVKYKYRMDKLNGEYKNREGGKSRYNMEKWKYLLNAPFKISAACCKIMKKNPAHRFYKESGMCPFVGTLAEESRLRKQHYMRTGCNAYDNKIPTSTPLAFWTEQDILQYIKRYSLSIASIYGDIMEGDDGMLYLTGAQRTGCMFCGFGCHLDKEPNRFQMLKKTHPKQWDYFINRLGGAQVLKYIGVHYGDTAQQ